MYLHIGTDKSVNINSIVGIFDLDNSTISKTTRNFLKQKKNFLITVVERTEIPKSIIVTKNNDIFLSQYAPNSLKKRLNS